jgi:alpha-amylase
MRIDAAKHVDKPFWTQFQPAANVYTVGELLDGDPEYVCNYMSDALDGVLNYPMFVSFFLSKFLDIENIMECVDC